MSDITVVIPSIPTRQFQLMLATDSVKRQTLQPKNVIIETDTEHAGAAITRQRGLDKVDTEWVAFLDDDDEFGRDHLKLLMEHANDTGADYVYSWFWTIPDGCDPFPLSHFTDPWDRANPRQTTVTTMVKTELAKSVGFMGDLGQKTIDGQRAGEDWDFTLGCNQLGIISHLPVRTWYWRHWGFGMKGIPGNTSGMGTRW
jgi:glycosyltransferase involved in cell wall biosynthesis